MLPRTQPPEGLLTQCPAAHNTVTGLLDTLCGLAQPLTGHIVTQRPASHNYQKGILTQRPAAQLLAGRLQALKEAAARTPPPLASSGKRKMPADLQRGLEAVVRPFYQDAENAPNANKAKAAVWRVLVQLIGLWTVESTIKTKMQQHNSKVTGEWGITKERLEGLASAPPHPVTYCSLDDLAPALVSRGMTPVATCLKYCGLRMAWDLQECGLDSTGPSASAHTRAVISRLQHG